MSRVVVIGGGIAGVSAIVGLRYYDKNVDITLIEPKEYCEMCWAAYRMPFDEWTAKGSLLPLAPFCENNKIMHIQKLVKALNEKNVVLDSGDVISFDVCIVATGASSQWLALGRGPPNKGSGDGTIQKRLDLVKKEGQRILDSGSVLIVGGGIIGIELAGDIAGFAEKAGKPMNVTLVHSGSRLCEEMDESASALVLQHLEQRKIKVILNERASIGNENKWTLKSGETIDAAEVIMTVGYDPCNAFMKAGDLDESCLDEKGWINTDDFFRVRGCNGHIFSTGDCSTALPKAAGDILKNNYRVGKNVKLTLDRISKEKSLDTVDNLKKKFVMPFHPRLVTTGPDTGVINIHSYFTMQRIIPWVKNYTMLLFIPKMTLGLSRDPNIDPPEGRSFLAKFSSSLKVRSMFF